MKPLTERQLLHEFALAAMQSQVILDAIADDREAWTHREVAIYNKLGELLKHSKRFELTADELREWEAVKREERWKP